MTPENREQLASTFAEVSHNILQERRDLGEPVSGAHSEKHLRAVADWVPEIGRVYGFSDHEVLLGIFSSHFHDIHRSDREDIGDDDAVRSAQKALEVLEHLHNHGEFFTTEEDRNAVSYAILHHDKPPEFFSDPDRREGNPISLNEKIHSALHVGDVLQRLGSPLIQRRSAFVGGERLAQGDLQTMKYEGSKIDAIHAILLESAVRLGWNSKENVYPERLKDVIAPAFSIQREWVAGLLAGRNLTVSIWVDILWNTRDGQGKNIFELSLENPPMSPNEIREVLEDVGKINDKHIELAMLNRDLVDSSIEAADYFSSNFIYDPELAIEAWNPKGEYAKRWKQGM